MPLYIWECVCVCVSVCIAYTVKTHEVTICVTAYENLWTDEKEDGKAQIFVLGKGT